MILSADARQLAAAVAAALTPELDGHARACAVLGILTSLGHTPTVHSLEAACHLFAQLAHPNPGLPAPQPSPTNPHSRPR
jgi:hypothetical protein